MRGQQAASLTTWHRLFGLTLTDLFTDSPFEVEMEKDLSIKRQLLDIVILRRKPGPITQPLPDGLQEMADYNLLTYKSLHQPLDAWAIDELLGHLVNYRKQVSPSLDKLLPLESFQMYGISTRFPKNLQDAVKLEQRQPGVYETTWGTHRVRVLVLREIPDKPENAVWELFSGIQEKVEAGAKQYRPRTPDISTVMDNLFKRYQLEGISMSYTWDDWRRDYARAHLHDLTPEERLEGLSAEEVLRHLSPEEVLRGMSPEQRLQGLSLDELKAYLRQLEQQEAHSSED